MISIFLLKLLLTKDDFYCGLSCFKQVYQYTSSIIINIKLQQCSRLFSALLFTFFFIRAARGGACEYIFQTKLYKWRRLGTVSETECIVCSDWIFKNIIIKQVPLRFNPREFVFCLIVIQANPSKAK